MDTNTGPIHGGGAHVKWGDQFAALIDGYRVMRGPDDTWTLDALVWASDPFRLAQTPLTFEAPHARGAWIWPIEQLDLNGWRLTARLGTLQ